MPGYRSRTSDFRSPPFFVLGALIEINENGTVFYIRTASVSNEIALGAQRHFSPDARGSMNIIQIAAS